MSKKEIKLDAYERELLDLFEQGSLKQNVNVDQEIIKAKRTALSHFKKDARINIRISKFDLAQIKRMAAVEGLPYQTLISSVLHKLVNKADNLYE
jgi:predicted DNA binding CopG/RHH family protein